VLCFQPCVPIVLHRRSCESVEDIGMNELVEWRPDSSMLVVAVRIEQFVMFKWLIKYLKLNRLTELSVFYGHELFIM
jgi:hypothetical protein